MNATRGTPVGLAALAALALACNLDKGPTAPGAPIRADQVAAAVSSFVCDVDGATWEGDPDAAVLQDRKSTRLNSSHSQISYAVFCLKKKQNTNDQVYAPIEMITYPQMETTTGVASSIAMRSLC